MARRERPDKKIDILDRDIPAGKLILSIVWPSFIEEFMSILVNYVDTAMVGSIGVHATAATALGNPIMMLTNSIMIGLSMGYSVLIGRSIGEGEKDRALKIMRQTVFLVLFFGTILNFLYAFVFSPYLPRLMGADPEIWDDAGTYIFHLGWSRIFIVAMFCANNIHRAQGHTKTAMKANVTANITNCVGNFLLIYPTRTITLFGTSFTMIGAGWGIKGAAVATSIANVIAFIYAFVTLFDKRNVVPLSFDGFPKFDLHLTLRTVKIGIPVAMERGIVSIGQLVITSLLANVGTSTLAAHNLAMTAESICFMSVMGFGTAATTLVAQWLGAGDHDRAQELANKCLQYAVTVMLCTSAFLFVMAPRIIDIFTNDQSVIDMGAAALRIECLAEVFSAIAMTISGVLRGAGDVKYSTVTSMLGMWVVRIPAAVYLVRFAGIGLNGVWIPMAADWIFRCLMMVARYRSGKWKHAFDA